MLFLNTQPVDRNCDANYGNDNPCSDDGYGDGNCRHLLKATIILAIIYLITSVVLSVLHAPVSLCVLATPLLVLACAAVAAHRRFVSLLWLCCITATLCTFGKILAIIIYSMVFGYSNIEDEYDLLPGTSKQRRTNSLHSDADYTRFFVALLIVEVLLLALCVSAAKFCLKCLR